jgi:hypothetical protein
VIGDVSGKGTDAARLTALCRKAASRICYSTDAFASKRARDEEGSSPRTVDRSFGIGADSCRERRPHATDARGLESPEVRRVALVRSRHNHGTNVARVGHGAMPIDGGREIESLPFAGMTWDSSPRVVKVAPARQPAGRNRDAAYHESMSATIVDSAV